MFFLRISVRFIDVHRPTPALVETSHRRVSKVRRGQWRLALRKLFKKAGGFCERRGAKKMIFHNIQIYIYIICVCVCSQKVRLDLSFKNGGLSIANGDSNRFDDQRWQHADGAIPMRPGGWPVDFRRCFASLGAQSPIYRRFGIWWFDDMKKWNDMTRMTRIVFGITRVHQWETVQGVSGLDTFSLTIATSACEDRASTCFSLAFRKVIYNI